MADGSQNGLTDKQLAVMERIDRRVPIKLIADDLSVSESRINQHIRKLKDRYGAASLNDLVASYRAEHFGENGGNEPFQTYRKPASRKNQLPETAINSDDGDRVASDELVFADALAFPIEAPWQQANEPQIVPGMLDGDNAVTYRLALMIAIAFGLVAAVILVVTALVSMTEALDGKARIPVEELTKPAG